MPRADRAFRRAYRDDPVGVLNRLPRRAKLARYPPLVQDRLRSLQLEAERAGVAWDPGTRSWKASDPPRGPSRGRRVDAALALATAGLALRAVRSRRRR